ncbi:hypothetical protein EDI_196670 [Entamoeba dispar SAW760]|uniref:Uncharacterized protein n=1 Tax=Entamoeba dispar (strain ATCC PRA-260 / SAW760) TaxID=370354 RepID=B0EQS8_ENTDS|nr:uncharacterized protein EDI_196670 [Entamoeba dispar SAW760]EDR23124.1 hypothetical protein EDI_196670 [Entamoeba dispar SAW760]|eukprot:EDR23124.1 hypothetical protein EDI_196670 [Entamoeba dispar SAW760]
MNPFNKLLKERIEQTEEETHEEEVKKQHEEDLCMKYLKRKQTEKEYEIYQQLTLIALLNVYCTFKLKRIPRQTNRTLFLPRVICLVFNEQIIDVETLATNSCKQIFKSDVEEGIQINTAQKRYDKNIKTFISNFLIDTALELGFTFDSKMTRLSGKTLRFERVHCIKKGKELTINRNGMKTIGNKMYRYMIEHYRDLPDVVFEHNDAEIKKIVDFSIQCVDVKQ